MKVQVREAAADHVRVQSADMALRAVGVVVPLVRAALFAHSHSTVAGGLVEMS